MFLILVHPMMWLDVGFIELLAGLGFWASVAPLLEYVAVRAANHTIDEKRKKEKDDKKVKRRAMERAKLE